MESFHLTSRMICKFKLQPHSHEPSATKLLCPLFIKNTSHSGSYVESQQQRSWSTPTPSIRVATSCLNSAICQGQSFHGNEVRVKTRFEQRDSGKWKKSWRAAQECNWSPGIFTCHMINMPLMDSRHICQQNKDTGDNYDPKCLNFHQLLTDKVFKMSRTLAFDANW